MPNAATRLCALVGYPVGHSLSPAMHNAAFRALGLNMVYVAFAVPPQRLGDAVGALKVLDFVGFNVTVPHKETCRAFLDELAPEAQAIGAVNTIVRRDGRLVGCNTDGEGFLRALREAGEHPVGRRALILGAGGAARAVAVTLARAGAAMITIANRTAEKALRLAADVTAMGGRAATMPWEALVGATPEGGCMVGSAELIVQTTTLGMAPHAAAVPLPAEWLTPRHVVVDIVYRPRGTLLLQTARQRGARVVDGLGMLLYQGAASFELWTGREAPVAVMRQALEEALSLKL